MNRAQWAPQKKKQQEKSASGTRGYQADYRFKYWRDQDSAFLEREQELHRQIKEYRLLS